MSTIFDYECTTADGELTIDDVSMHTPGWTVLNPFILWNPAEQRGEDLLVPERPGALPLPRRITTTQHTLEMVIRGTHNHNGTPYANESFGLWANIEYLNQNVVEPSPYMTDTTRFAELAIPASPVVMQGYVHVDRLELGDRIGPFCRAAITLTIPAGRLEPFVP